MDSGDISRNNQQLLSIFNAFVILLVPSIGINNTLRQNAITETTLMWPWMILVRLEPIPEFHTDMYQFVFPPWTLILFAPFLFGLRYTYQLYHEQEQRVRVSSWIILTAVLQIFLIWVVYQSQDPRVTEVRTIYFIPQLLIILVQGFFTAKWFYSDTKKTLTTPIPKDSDDPAEIG